MKNSRIALTAVTTAAVLGVAACGADSAPSNPDDTVTMSSSESSTSESSQPSESSTSSETPSETGSQSPDSDGGLSAVTSAIEAAEAETGGTTYEVDDQDRDGSWEIDLAKDGTSIEVKVSADGKVTDRETDDLDDDDRTALDSAKVTITEAIEQALAEADGAFDDAELEEENGTYYWKVSVDTDTDSDADDDDRDVLVDVTNGTVSVTE